MRALTCVALALISAYCSRPTYAALQLGPVTMIDVTNGFEPIKLRSSGGVVTWQYKPSSEQSQIKVWDPIGGLRTIASSGTSQRELFDPDVSGRTVLWTETIPGGNTNVIKGYNLNTNSTFNVTGPSPRLGGQSIEQNVVVYSQLGSNGFDDVWRLALPNGPPQAVSTDSNAYEGAPDISGSRVAYYHLSNFNSSGRPTRSAIRVQDLNDDSILYEHVGPTNSYIYGQPRPMIDGNLVGWFQSDSSSPLELHVANYVTGQKWVMPRSERAAMSNGIVVWNDTAQDATFALNTFNGETSLLRPSAGATQWLTLDGFRLTWVEFLGQPNGFAVKTAFIPEPSSFIGVIVTFAALRRHRR